MTTPEECQRESQDSLASERRSKEQFSHLEHRVASAETAAVSQFLQRLFERIVSFMVSAGPMQQAQFTVSKRTSLNPQ